jgi:hypothetical protein
LEETTWTIEKTSFLVGALSLEKKLNLKVLGYCKFFAIKSNQNFMANKTCLQFIGFDFFKLEIFTKTNTKSWSMCEW